MAAYGIVKFNLQDFAHKRYELQDKLAVLVDRPRRLDKLGERLPPADFGL
jgi:hypothetical protein